MLIKYLKKNDRFIYAGTEYVVERSARPGEPLRTECDKRFIDNDLDVELLTKEQKPYNTKDALGNEIQIGENYGYSAHGSGITIVRLGKALRFTKTGLLTMEIYSSQWALNMDELCNEHMEKNIASYKPSQLFPI